MMTNEIKSKKEHQRRGDEKLKNLSEESLDVSGGRRSSISISIYTIVLSGVRNGSSGF